MSRDFRDRYLSHLLPPRPEHGRRPSGVEVLPGRDGQKVYRLGGPLEEKPRSTDQIIVYK